MRIGTKLRTLLQNTLPPTALGLAAAQVHHPLFDLVALFAFCLAFGGLLGAGIWEILERLKRVPPLD